MNIDYSYIVMMLFLVLLSAYFSATETAFSSMNKVKIKSLLDKDGKRNKRAELVLKLSDDYNKLISTILVGNNIVNISLASLGTVFFIALDKDNGATLSTVVITIVVLIFGEISPKSIAKDCPERFAMFSAPIINFCIIVLAPINFLFTLWKKLLTLIFKVEDDSKISSEELIMMVEEVEQEGSLDEEDSEIIKNAIEFTECTVESILTHRVDLAAVDIETSNDDVAKLFLETQFSRILVYENTIDNIVGVVHMKDFYIGTGVTNKSIKDIMTVPVFVQKYEKVNDLLKLLQKHKSHIAVVIDGFGGTLGIVTMEDILEELVGEIWDEHDEVIEFIKTVDNKLFNVDCTMDLVEFSEYFEINIDSDNVSLGGWIMEQLGKVPEVNDSFIYSNLTIKILSTDYHRVQYIEVVRIEPEPTLEVLNKA